MTFASNLKWAAAAAALAVMVAAPWHDADARSRRGTAALVIGGLAAGALITGLALSNSNARPVKQRCVRKRVWVEDAYGDRYRTWRRVCS